MNSEMFASWRSLDPRKVAPLLRQHRKLLSYELRAIRALLTCPTEANLTMATERTKRLRQQYRSALSDHIEASKAMSRSLTFQNFLHYADVFKAQSELLGASCAVSDLLAEQPASPPESPKQQFRGPLTEPTLDVDFDSLSAWAEHPWSQRWTTPSRPISRD